MSVQVLESDLDRNERKKKCKGFFSFFFWRGEGRRDDRCLHVKLELHPGMVFICTDVAFSQDDVNTAAEIFD